MARPSKTGVKTDLEPESSVDSISVKTPIFMPRESNDSYDWIIDRRVDIMAAFLAFIKFEIVKGEQNCVYSEWTEESIGKYWGSRRQLTKIATFDEDLANDGFFSPEIRIAIKAIIPNHLISFYHVNTNGSYSWRLRFYVNDQNTWDIALRTTLKDDGIDGNYGTFFAVYHLWMVKIMC